MRTYFLDFIPSIIRSSRRLDDLTMIKNHHWVLINPESSDKTVLIFLSENRLKIVNNGIRRNSTWEILENSYLDIDLIEYGIIAKYVFVDEEFLILKIDSNEEHIAFINETRYGIELNTIDDIKRILKIKYPNGRIEKHQLLFSFIKEHYTFKMGSFSEYAVKFNNTVLATVYHSSSKECYFIYELNNNILTFRSRDSFLNYLVCEV